MADRKARDRPPRTGQGMVPVPRELRGPDSPLSPACLGKEPRARGLCRPPRVVETPQGPADCQWLSYPGHSRWVTVAFRITQPRWPRPALKELRV